jgi:hypothetical protein
MKKAQLQRKIIATLHDGKEMKILVYKMGSYIELHFDNPYNERSDSIVVHKINADSPEKWIHEINVQRDHIISVVDWRFYD